MHSRFQPFTDKGHYYEPLRFNPPLAAYAERAPAGSDVLPAPQLAQFFVGLNVGSIKMITADEVRDYAMQLRDEQLAAKGDIQHGGSLTPLLGWWRKTSDRPHSGTEDSVMLEILNLGDETPEEFHNNMTEIAEDLAVHFKQDAIAVRFWDEGQIQSGALYYSRED